MKKTLKFLTTIVCVSLLSSPIIFNDDTPFLHESYTTEKTKYNSDITILPKVENSQLTTDDNNFPMIVETSDTDHTENTDNNSQNEEEKSTVNNTDKNSHEINGDDSNNNQQNSNTSDNNSMNKKTNTTATNNNSDNETYTTDNNNNNKVSNKNNRTDTAEQPESKTETSKNPQKQQSETSAPKNTDTKKSDSKNNKQSNSQIKRPSVSKSTSQSSPKKQSHFNNVKTLKAAIKGQDKPVEIAKVDGNGTMQIVVTRNKESAAKQMPTYVSMSCKNNMDGNVYSGAFNTMSNETIVKTIPFSGKCTLKVRVDHPSESWNGTYNSIHVSYGNIKYISSENSYSKKADWTTKAITNSSSYSLKAPKHFTGNVVLKMTNCSTRGGATDKTASFACDGYVQKKKNTSGRIEILNGGKVVASQNYNIVYQKHHETFTIPVKNLQSDNLTVKIYKDNGPAILLHGPGSSIVGTY